VYLLLIAGALVTALPFFVVVTTALKSTPEVYADTPTIWPQEFRFGNFRKALFGSEDTVRAFNFLRCLRNSVCIVLLSMIGTVLSCSVVAYGFARFNSRWNRPLFALMLSAMMLPPIVTSIPRFVLFVKYFGWYDTLYPLWVPTFFGINAFCIFLLHEFFRGLPQSLIEAARIDGCGELGILFRIVMPLSKPALMVAGVFTFMWTWNDYFNPLIFLEDPDKFTLALGLTHFIQGSRGSLFGTQWNLLLAASLVVCLPVIVLFFMAQRYFIEGITLTGIKQ